MKNLTVNATECTGIKNTLSHKANQDSDMFRTHSVHPKEVLHQTNTNKTQTNNQTD